MQYDPLNEKKCLKWRFIIENIIITLMMGVVMYAIWTFFYTVFE